MPVPSYPFFRRNAITDVVNAAGGDLSMASQLFGNSPEVKKRNPQTLSNQGVAVLTRRAIDGARTRLLLALKIR